MGIYQIKNLVNGKVYIGSAVNFKNRFKTHKCLLKLNSHHSKHLQNAWNKYGEDNFKFEICEVLEFDEDLLRVEQYYLDFFEPWDREVGYNTAKYADAPMRGRTHTLEAIEKQSIAHTNPSDETRKKQSDAKMGEKSSWYGKPKSDEWKKRQSELMSDENHPLYGTHWDDEERRQKHIDRFTGDNNPMSGKSVYDVWLSKFGKEEAVRRYKQMSDKLSKSNAKPKNYTDAELKHKSDSFFTQPRGICKYCGKEMHVSQLSRWHNGKCKERK